MKKMFLLFFAGTLLSVGSHAQTTAPNQSKSTTAANGKSNASSKSTSGKTMHSKGKQYMGEKVKREGKTGTKEKLSSGSAQ